MPQLAQTESDTRAAGRALAAQIAPGTIVLLYGDLGAGKTVFVRGLAEGLGLDPDAVSSPTFTIVQEYRGPALTLQHVDLYRLVPTRSRRPRARRSAVGVDRDGD